MGGSEDLGFGVVAEEQPRPFHVGVSARIVHLAKTEAGGDRLRKVVDLSAGHGETGTWQEGRVGNCDGRGDAG